MFYNAKGSKTKLQIGKRKDGKNKFEISFKENKTPHQTAPLSNVEAVI
jgi:hypothetical protein